MQTNKHLISSIAKGLVIGALLVFFHIVASGNGSTHTNDEILSVANDIAPGSQENEETYFAIESYGVNAVMNLEIVREMLVLQIVVFCVNSLPTKFTFGIPIPLGKHLNILFSSLICPNGP